MNPPLDAGAATILSKFIIMAMHTHMKGFIMPYHGRVLLHKYRISKTDRWSWQE